jgi:threonine/homoserine/homoserine lactone efflux protein
VRGYCEMIAQMPDPHTLLLFTAASFALLVVPGPAVIYVVTRSVSQGRRAGIVSMLGIETGGLVHVAAAALGLSALLASSVTAFTALKYLGAAYLLYLGIRKLTEQGDELDEPSEGHSHPRLFWEGVLVQVLNPKVALFFLAFLPQFIDPASGGVTLQVVVLGLCFTGLAVLSDGAYALAAGTVGGWLRARRNLRRWLVKLSGGVYIGLGAAAAFSGTRLATTE